MYLGTHKAHLRPGRRVVLPKRLKETLKSRNPDNWKTLHIVSINEGDISYLALLDNKTWRNKQSFYEIADSETSLSPGQRVVMNPQCSIQIPKLFIRDLNLKTGEEIVFYGHNEYIELFNQADALKCESGESLDTLLENEPEKPADNKEYPQKPEQSEQPADNKEYPEPESEPKIQPVSSNIALLSDNLAFMITRYEIASKDKKPDNPLYLLPCKSRAYLSDESFFRELIRDISSNRSFMPEKQRRRVRSICLNIRQVVLRNGRMHVSKDAGVKVPRNLKSILASQRASKYGPVVVLEYHSHQ